MTTPLRCRLFRETGKVDKDDHRPLFVRLEGHLAPGDVRPIDFLDAPRTPIEDIRVRRFPSSSAWQRLFEDGVESPRAEAAVWVTCQIETDHSVVCGGLRAPGQPPEVVAILAPVIYAGMARVLMMERKTDGTSSIDAVFDFKLEFKLFD